MNNQLASTLASLENEGVVFKVKLIGSELVMEPRGDKMCQNSIQRLKAIIKGTNSHKRRVVMKISYDGVKVSDEKTNELLYHHEVAQISYIASDDTDNRTFGYVSDVPNRAHQFICFKTSGPAINVMSVISALFEAVLERKNQAEKENQNDKKTATSTTTTGAVAVADADTKVNLEEIISTNDILEKPIVVNEKAIVKEKQQVQQIANSSGKQNQRQETEVTTKNIFAINQSQDSFDLIGDSGIMEGDTSINFSAAGSYQSAQLPPSPQLNQNHQQQSQPRMQFQRPPPQDHLPSSQLFSSSQMKQQKQQQDKYAVFNDIDNLPSIFESASLSKIEPSKPIKAPFPQSRLAQVNASFSQSFNQSYMQPSSSSANFGSQKLSQAAPRSTSTTDVTMFRQTNPFDDDFFA